jgi:hypothetical protein
VTVAIPEVAAAAGSESAAAGTVEGGAPLRTPRPGRSAMAADRANRPPRPKPKPPAAPTPVAQPDEEEKPAAQPDEEDQGDRGPRRSLPNPGGAVREGSWVVLGFLGWVWVALPFIKGGPSRVGQVLAAKFINRTPEGK